MSFVQSMGTVHISALSELIVFLYQFSLKYYDLHVSQLVVCCTVYIIHKNVSHYSLSVLEAFQNIPRFFR